MHTKTYMEVYILYVMDESQFVKGYVMSPHTLCWDQSKSMLIKRAQPVKDNYFYHIENVSL